MTIVTQYDWESDTFTHNGDTAARTAWRAAVAEIADKARAKLPECNGRVDSAVKMVLAGDVELLPDGTAKVASQSNGTTAYHVVNGHCDCRDYEKAPHNFCKHRLSAAISRRVQGLVKAQASNGQVDVPPAPAPVQPEAPAAPLPEAPVSITLKGLIHGQEVMVTLRGIDFASVKAQVEAASQWLDVKGSQPADTTPQCPTHGAMKPSTKGKGWYCPVKMADGSWCKSR